MTADANPDAEYDLRKLSELLPNDRAILVKMVAGKELARRMVEMGVSLGSRMRVVRGSGPMIIETRGHRLVIGRGMVDKLLVRVLSESDPG